MRACGSFSELRSVFHNFSNKKDIFLYNVLLSNYALYRNIILLLVELVSVAGLLPDNFMLPCAVEACAGLIEVELEKVLHALTLKLGLCSYSFVKNALIAMYELLLNSGGDEGLVSVVAAIGEVNLGMLLHGLALKLSF
ncbi:hypothetical protein AHAS_Ahas15G0131600 [Arachis hypogaea]